MASSNELLLAVDVGNTQTHFGVFDRGGAEVIEQWRFATARQSTCDQLALVLKNLLELRGLRLEQVTASILSTTVPQLQVQWLRVAREYLGHEMLSVGPALKTGMPIRIDNPHEVGPDRLVNSVAAYDRVHDSCIVVDFGTAINYDVVSADGEYLGGILSPGAEVSIDALAERAAALSRVQFAPPKAVIGKSTTEALRSGIAYGFAGQVEGILRRLRAEIGADTTVIATGGFSSVIVPFVEARIDQVDPLLTLTGLRLIWERNSR